jgi:hypothetical protein
MPKSLIMALTLMAAWPITVPALQIESTVAFREPSPDRSTGPYNPNAPQGGPTARGMAAA